MTSSTTDIFSNIEANNKRESASSSVMNTMLHLLMEKKLKPGDQIPSEFELMEVMGVGRNSVREAVKMLSILGVVEIRKGVGSFVAKSIPPEAFNPLVISLIFEQQIPMSLVELRILIDNGVGDLVIRKASESDINHLEIINDQILESNSENKADSDNSELNVLDNAFHKELFRIADNPMVTKIGTAIYQLFDSAMEKSIVVNPIQAYKNHQLIIEAIRMRDNSLYRESTEKSLDIWKEYITF